MTDNIKRRDMLRRSAMFSLGMAGANNVRAQEEEDPFPHMRIEYKSPAKYSPLVYLQNEGLTVARLKDPKGLASIKDEQPPDVVLLDTTFMSRREQKECIEECRSLGLPVVGLIPEDRLPKFDLALGLDDFLVLPVRPFELVARIHQMLGRSMGANRENVIRAGDLEMDLDSYEVFLAGHRVMLAFKEYELLRVLVTNPGRVYTREALLNQVWGYDYFGGTRTVDVHIRRLRSKIEDVNHSFIDTVRNVGYRFREAVQS